MPGRMAEVTERSVVSHGYRIHLREAGSGPLVVMLHGFPESAHSYRHQVPALAKAGHHAVALNMLGGGRSSKPAHRDAHRITEIVATVVGVVEALGKETATVVGHDWGAPAAWVCAWTRPDVFTGVLGASVPFGGRHLLPWPGALTADLRPSELRARLADPGNMTYVDYFARPGTLEAAVDADLRWFFEAVFHGNSAAGGAPTWDSFADDREMLDFLAATPLIVRPGEAFTAALRAPELLPDWLPEADLEAFVAEFEFTGLEHLLNRYRLTDIDCELLASYEGTKIVVPSLFVGGDRDVALIWGREAILNVGDLAADAREPIVIADRGHWVQQEKPAEFNRALLDFLAEIVPARPGFDEVS